MAVVMPAYNAASTLEKAYADIPHERVDDVIVVDDFSGDETVEIARRLGAHVIAHPENRGYGGSQKSGYDAALERGAQYVVMLHADFQYDARLIAPAIEILESGVCDVVLGNRIRTCAEALGGGMPWIKYAANRGLTLIENVLAGQNLGEWHSGFRAYRREVLEQVPYRRNSDAFAFDSQFLVQCVHHGFRLGDVPIPVRYFKEASSIGLRDSATYALATLGVFSAWFAHRLRLRRSPLFEKPS